MNTQTIPTGDLATYGHLFASDGPVVLGNENQLYLRLLSQKTFNLDNFAIHPVTGDRLVISEVYECNKNGAPGWVLLGWLFFLFFFQNRELLIRIIPDISLDKDTSIIFAGSVLNHEGKEYCAGLFWSCLSRTLSPRLVPWNAKTSQYDFLAIYWPKFIYLIALFFIGATMWEPRESRVFLWKLEILQLSPTLTTERLL